MSDAERKEFSLERTLYSAVVRLHPAAFREEFGREMALDFEDARRERGFAPLLADGMLSLGRQWKERVLSGAEPEQAGSYLAFLPPSH